MSLPGRSSAGPVGQDKMTIKSTIDKLITGLIMLAILIYLSLIFTDRIKPSDIYTRILFSGSMVLLTIQALVSSEVSARGNTVKKADNPVGYWCACLFLFLIGLFFWWVL